jgi:hypothetical protein
MHILRWCVFSLGGAAVLKVQFNLHPTLARDLQGEARRLGLSVSEISRWAVVAWITRRGRN